MRFEPSADDRQTAIEVRRTFEAFTEVGFTEQQSFILVLEQWRTWCRLGAEDRD